MKPFRWAVCGSGFAARKFVLGLRAAENAVVVVVGSRSLMNARRFAARYGVETAVDSYRRTVERDDIDAVYVATPSSLHREHAVMALSAGKPVLVEKPFATSAREAHEIAAAARRNDVFCMEAMWTRFLPAIRQVKQLIDDGAIGEVVMMTASFSFADAVDEKNSLYNAALGGGALLNRGVYPLSLALHFLGTPDGATAEALIGDTGVDEAVAIVLRYDRGALATVSAGTRSVAPNDCWILGTQGRIYLHAPIYRPFRVTMTPIRERVVDPDVSASRLNSLKERNLLQGAYQRFGRFVTPLLNRNFRTFTIPYRGNGYHYEADAVRRAVEAGELESSIMPISESVQLLELIDRIRSGGDPESSGARRALPPGISASGES